MEKNLVHSNLDFLKILEKYTLERKSGGQAPLTKCEQKFE